MIFEAHFRALDWERISGAYFRSLDWELISALWTDGSFSLISPLAQHPRGAWVCPPFSGALYGHGRREATSKPESRRGAPVATPPSQPLVLLVLLLGGNGGMGIRKRRDLLAAPQGPGRGNPRHVPD